MHILQANHVFMFHVASTHLLIVCLHFSSFYFWAHCIFLAAFPHIVTDVRRSNLNNYNLCIVCLQFVDVEKAIYKNMPGAAVHISNVSSKTNMFNLDHPLVSQSTLWRISLPSSFQKSGACPKKRQE